MASQGWGAIPRVTSQVANGCFFFMRRRVALFLLSGRGAAAVPGVAAAVAWGFPSFMLTTIFILTRGKDVAATGVLLTFSESAAIIKRPEEGLDRAVR